MEAMKVWVCRNCGRGMESVKQPVCGVCLETMLNSGYRVQSELERAENAIASLEADCAGLAAKCETIRRMYARRVKQLSRFCREYKAKAEARPTPPAPWMDYAAVVHAVRSAYIEGAGDFYRGEPFNKERDVDEWWLDSDSKRRLGPGPKRETT